jgi:hypothetical protein
MDGEGFLTEILLNGDDGHVASLDDINIPVTQETDFGTEVQQIDMQVQVQGTGGTKGAKRTRNFNYEEDEVICSGWLNVSKDPINGVNQSRTTFWGRVHTFFEKNKKTEAIMTESSIMHRWLTIQAQVNKYCACYEAIWTKNPSWPEMDLFTNARLFMDEEPSWPDMEDGDGGLDAGEARREANREGRGQGKELGRRAAAKKITWRRRRRKLSSGDVFDRVSRAEEYDQAAAAYVVPFPRAREITMGRKKRSGGPPF